MFIKQLRGNLVDFKELIANEIEEVLVYSKEDGNPNGEDQKQQRMTQVMTNIPNVRDMNRGLLKTKSKSKKKIKKQMAQLPTGMKMIHPAHQNFNMVFNIMLGIKKAIDSTLDIPLIHATDKDFNLRC